MPSCNDIVPRDQDATDRRLLPITSNYKHPCLVSSTASDLRLPRVGPWHFTMPGPLRRTAWCVGGVFFPCRLLYAHRRSNRRHIRHSRNPQKGMLFIPSRKNFEPRLFLSPPREKKRESTTRRAFPRTAALPQTRGPGFPGARTGSSLSHRATSPLRNVSRHLFEVRVFQRAACPRGRAFVAVPAPLGSRARFRALCLTPRFFEPRCRRTTSAISLLTHGHTHRTATLARIDLVSKRFCPTIGHPKGRMRATEFLVGLHPDAYAPEPELQRPNPEGNGDEFSWVGRPE